MCRIQHGLYVGHELLQFIEKHFFFFENFLNNSVHCLSAESQHMYVYHEVLITVEY